MYFAIPYPFEYVKRKQIHHINFGEVDNVGGDTIQKKDAQVTFILK